MVIVSIVVPVYNAQRTLKRCLDNLLNQTFADFEIILINDGSVDDSLMICESYSKLDDRIKLFSQENGGVSTARNLGIKVACGQYVCFVDSDDSVEVDFLEKLLHNAPEKDFLVIQGFKKVDINGMYISTTTFLSGRITKDDFILLFGKYNICFYGFVCSKLFCREVLINHKILFDKNICFSEDLLFLLDYLCCINVVVFSDCSNYLYYNNEYSLSHNLSSYEKEFLGLVLYLEKMKKISTCLGIPDREILHYSDNSLTRFLNRIAQSIYLTFANQREERIVRLREVSTSFCDLFLYVRTSTSLFYYLFWKMMVYKCFRISDFILTLYFLLRKINNFIMKNIYGR